MKTVARFMIFVTLCSAGVFAAPPDQTAGNENAAYPVAVLPFSERSREVAEQGKVVADILFAGLAANPEIVLVDREDLDTALKEQELSLSGVVNPAHAVRVGNIIGAKILVTGSVVRAETATYLIAKIIGTETTLVRGVSVKGGPGDGVEELAETLAGEVVKTILKDGPKLVAKPLTRDNRIASLKEKLDGKKRTVLLVDIPETHMTRRSADPAAETEFSVYARELGFTLPDKNSGDKTSADFLLVGEAFSERGMPIGNMVSVKARVELKAVARKSGKIIAVDRQRAVAVDLAETVAAKHALQQAGAALAERMLPKLVQY